MIRIYAARVQINLKIHTIPQEICKEQMHTSASGSSPFTLIFGSTSSLVVSGLSAVNFMDLKGLKDFSIPAC
jgi:uncharacterized membrane protein